MRWRAWASWTALLLLSALALAALLAPVGQARVARERSPEEEAALSAGRASRQAERQERSAASKARHEAERRAAREEHEAQGGGRKVQNSSRPRVHGEVHFSCTQVVWKFTKFPDGANSVVHVLNIESEEPRKIAGTFDFDGPEGETTTSVLMPPGTYKVDAWAKWKGNGLKGSFDIIGKMTCKAKPEFSIEKLQRIAGSGGSFTSSPLEGEVGQTVEYEIVLTNEGNVPLTFGELADAKCDEGTLSGGPGDTPVAPGASATYKCTHLLSDADREAGSRSNKAMTTGTPPEGDGSPISHTSNTVIVTLAAAKPAFSVQKLQMIEGSGGSFTTSTLTGQVGQTVDYEIVVKNEGNVLLSFASFTDSQCDSGTITGGPPGGMLAAGASATYTCKHLLTIADQTAGSLSNTATLAGTPPGGSPITQSSNTVVVEVAPPTPPGGGTPQTPPPSGGKSGILSSSVTQLPESGVLATLASIPGLKAPQGCVRSSFRASVKSAGVQSVTFYLDGHRLKTLTARNAHKGLLTIQINPSKWKVGAHKLLAKITMAHTGSTKARTASRTVRVVRCHAALLTPKFTG